MWRSFVRGCIGAALALLPCLGCLAKTDPRDAPSEFSSSSTASRPVLIARAGADSHGRDRSLSPAPHKSESAAAAQAPEPIAPGSRPASLPRKILQAPRLTRSQTPQPARSDVEQAVAHVAWREKSAEAAEPTTDGAEARYLGRTADYAQLRGRLQYLKVRGVWSLRFAWDDDRLGGVVTLAPDAVIDPSWDGKFVQVNGTLLEPSAPGASALYHCQTISLQSAP